MLLSLRVSGVVLWFTGSLLELTYANPSHWAQPVLCVCAVGAFQDFFLMESQAVQFKRAAC